MSSDLERRLGDLFAAAPEPDAGAGEEALHRALQALEPSPPARRALRTAALAFAAAVVLLAIAAGSLAAAGALHVSFGAKTKQQQHTIKELTLPAGTSGIAAVVDGRLSAVTRGGFRIEGLRVTAAALSPHSLFVAAGIGHSLVALAPGGGRPWSQAAGGKVVAIAWAPFGNRIAYIVRAGRRLVLHVIWGNGTHDALIDNSVRRVNPSWRGDSLAFAYVGVGGRAIVYDVGHSAHHIVRTAARDVTSLAFAQSGPALALGTRSGIWLGRRRILPGSTAGFGWLGRDLLAEASGRYVVIEPVGIEPAYRPLLLGGRVALLAAGDDRFVAVVQGRVSQLVAGTTTHAQTVLTLPRGTRIDSVSIG